MGRVTGGGVAVGSGGEGSWAVGRGAVGSGVSVGAVVGSATVEMLEAIEAVESSERRPWVPQSVSDCLGNITNNSRLPYGSVLPHPQYATRTARTFEGGQQPVR